LTRDLVARGLSAVEWVRKPAEAVDGGGGGRPDMAQAGGKDASKLAEALEAARSEIQRLLG
jgi:alanyl-tRNA synthetase